MLIRGRDDRQQNTLRLAAAFLDETRRQLERAVAAGVTMPPVLRSVHEKAAHATPEFRTVAIPVPPGCAGLGPGVLSGLIAHFAAEKEPVCLLLALDTAREGEGAGSLFVVEARDLAGTRRVWMQPYRVQGAEVRWAEPVASGWAEPDEEEAMVLDEAFASVQVPAH